MNPSQPMVGKIVEVQIAWEWTGLHLLMTNTAVKQVCNKNKDRWFWVNYSEWRAIMEKTAKEDN